MAFKKTWHFAIPTALFMTALTSLASAAPQCTTSPFIELWVDPFDGDDLGTHDPGDPTTPFKTLTMALASGGTLRIPGDQVVIHALPGLYSSTSNGETFPLQFSPGLHLQGAGAKECVLRSDESQGGWATIWPVPGPTSNRRSSRVIVDFSGSTELGGPSSIDGMTFQGADVQVYLGPDVYDSSARVSNCVFDMRHEEMPGNSGPYFGVLVGSTWREFSAEGYIDNTVSLLNNTFIQGWRFENTDTGVQLSRADAVAICDVNDPYGSNSSNSDPNKTLRGISTHNIQNNLIRCLDSAPRTATLGIDSLDMTVLGQGPSNAFDSGQASVGNGSFSSALSGALVLPTPRVDLQNPILDAGFVGEMISQTAPIAGTIVRDFRILPDSSLVDQGIDPLAEACYLSITAANGQSYQDRYAENGWLARVYDFDGEVHGNPRRNGTIDIGFDESDLYCTAGSYGNDTKSHHLRWRPDTFIENGLNTRSLIFPNAGKVILASTLDVIPVGTPTGWTIMPGTVATPIVLGLPSFFSWLDLAHLTLSVTAPIDILPATWMNPEANGTMHSFGLIQFIQNDISVPLYFNTQAHVVVPDGLMSSNLQSEYL